MRRLALASLLVGVACFDEGDKPKDSHDSTGATSSGTSTDTSSTSESSTSEASADTSSSSSGEPMDCTSSCAACLHCTIFAECNPVYEECKADEGCAPLIGCAMGCWSEEDAAACFDLTCQCGPPGLPTEMLACITDQCGSCVTLEC